METVCPNLCPVFTLSRHVFCSMSRTEVISSVMRPCREGAICLLSYSRRLFLPSIKGVRQFNAGCVPTVVPVSPLSSSI